MKSPLEINHAIIYTELAEKEILLVKLNRVEKEAQSTGKFLKSHNLNVNEWLSKNGRLDNILHGAYLSFSH